MKKIFVYAALFFLLAAQNGFAATDSISSTVRGSNSVAPGSIGSTLRAGPSKPDPMLNTNMGVPASAISSTSMDSADPMLNTTMGVPPSAISTSAGPPVDPKLCNALVKHTPDADVAYQSGVDVNGNAVAPADLPNSPQMQLPSKYTIPLTFSLAQTLHLDTSKYPFSTLGAGTEGIIGNLTVEGDKAYFNGQPLSDAQQDNLSVVCMKQTKTK